MRTPALSLALAVLLSSRIYAQATWQPAAPPLVTAENTTWYQAAEPIIWNGDYYYPAGAVQGFNPYQMVRSGSYRGIPLYTDATLEPYSIVFVPLNGARMQPYERRRSGQLAGTTGSRTPSLPTDIGAEGVSPAMTQAQGPPDFARAYDVARLDEPAPFAAPADLPVGTAGSAAPPVRPVTTILPPTGLNAIWIEYNGERWYASGQSIAYEAARLNRVGSYRGWSVYALKSDPRAATIYVPSIPGRLAPYSRK
ncbi:MAG TPA: hypothetical protein VFK57_16390 [Vicinamibacterales bacterium]|nr:hypothetical protein [Vicinamibacterales bacterium]